MPYQPNSGPPQHAYRGPPNSDLSKTLCYISGPNDLQNKISWLQKQFWRNQARSQVLRFGVQNTLLGGNIFIFIKCLKQSFLSTTKYRRAQKRFWGNCPRMPYRVCWPGQNCRQKVFHWGPSCLWHSENLFLIHNMNSICRLCKLHYKDFPATTHNRRVLSNYKLFERA